MVTTAFIQATGAFLRHGNGAFAAAGQLGAALAFGGQRCFSSMPQTSELKAVLAQKIPTEQARLKSIKKQLGSKSLGEVTVDMCIGGMRGIPVRVPTARRFFECARMSSVLSIDVNVSAHNWATTSASHGTTCATVTRV
eukprot:GHRQ01033129.1.p1 GENE.GHRQ01033129.1~~GHRQ01033129.1.p1  ORF type:complete len:139 (+),score=9.88 GHRQ01033129.1:196-612(+)